MRYQFSIGSMGTLGYGEERFPSNHATKVYAVKGSGQLYTTLPDLWKIRFESEEQFEKIKHYFITRNHIFEGYKFTGSDRAFTSDFQYIADIGYDNLI